VARKKATDKPAEDQEEGIKRVQADRGSTAIGNISIGRDLSGSFTIGYTADQVSLLLSQITTRFQPKPFSGECPYKGLEVFEEEDAGLFFGRERLVEELIGRVKESRAVFITGPSGSGKSSLVRAGLIHALKEGAIRNSKGWLYETMKPGREPLKDLALAFSRLKSPELADYFQAHVEETDILHRCAESVLSGRGDQRFVLFVDQFEEVFTQVNQEAERVAFLEMLAHAGTAADGRVIVLFAMRSDFVSNCAAYPALNELLSGQFRQIGAMQPEELVAAIALPAKKVGLPVEAELIAQIINDMKGEPGALPLMQFALKELFEARGAKGGDIALTLEDYLARGGIQKMLARHADATLSRFSPEQQELVRSVFGGLIEIGRGRQDTRRTALFDELIPANTKTEDVEIVVRQLADARLVITDEQAGKDTVTIAHERLISAWPWLKKLIDENHDVIALQNTIINDAKEWEDNKRDKSYLYQGTRLAKVQKQLTDKKVKLSGVADQFIRVSISQQRRQRWTAVPLTTFITIIIIPILAIGVYDYLVSLTRDQSFRSFISASSPEQRLIDLAKIYKQKGILSNKDSDLTAAQLFYGLSTAEDQLSMFKIYDHGDATLQNDLIVVIGHLYTTIANVDPEVDNTELLQTMLEAISNISNDPVASNLRVELALWVDGRNNSKNGIYEEALANYENALTVNPGNPALLYERAKIYIVLREYNNALKDLDACLGLAKKTAPNIPTVTPTSAESSTSSTVTSVPPEINETPTIVITPALELTMASTPVPTAIPTYILTPKYESNFTTLIDIVNAVRALIQNSPELQIAMQSNSETENANLKSFGIYFDSSTASPTP
jgi:tetratricopeptide (TPR) repeat protein